MATTICLTCNKKFEIRPRFKNYCSTACKNPINRPGHIPWNLGIKLTEEQKSKQNTEGLKKGREYWKGKKNERQREKWLRDNPNKDGKVNNSRPKSPVSDEFILYKRECRKATYRSCYKMKQEGLVPENTGKRKDQYQLDHIIPFRQGFDLGLSPSVIGGRKNLRYILGEENRKKWDQYQSDEVVKIIIGE